MHGLADYIMRRRRNAVLVATVTSVLWVIFPPVAHLSAATLSLVALRLGLKEALKIGLIVSGLIVLLAMLSGKAVSLAASLLLVLVLMFWLPTLILSSVLRTTASLAAVVKAAAAGYTVVLLGFYLAVGSPYEWWQSVLTPISGMLQEQAGLQQLNMNIETLVEQIAKVMTGVMAASFLFVAVFNLLIARWWQSLLYNVGGFAREFQSLTLGKPMAMITLATVLIALIGNITLASDMLFVLGSCYFLQGIAILHAVSEQLKIHRLWMIGVYILLLFIPQTMLILAILGLIDHWVDFRTRWKNKVKLS